MRLSRLGQAIARRRTEAQARRREAMRQRFRLLKTSERKDLVESQRRMRKAREETVRYVSSLESPGRRVGSVAGSHIDSLCALRQAVMLCWQCAPKFAPNGVPSHPEYVFDRHYKVSGQCDGCRTPYFNGSLRFFTHESYIAKGQFRLHEPVR